MVKHGQVRVNDKKIDVPSYKVPYGAKLKLVEKAYNSQNYLQANKRPRLQLPAYLKKEEASGKENGTLVALPVLGDVPFQFEQQYLIEYYYKLK
jgi:small subunit ribosomal protein S4